MLRLRTASAALAIAAVAAVAAGCGGSSSGSSGQTPKQHAAAQARAINLVAADLPGFTGKPHTGSDNSAKLIRCAGGVDPSSGASRSPRAGRTEPSDCGPR